MQTSHIYPGAHSLNAYITINGCSDAIEFYKKAFGAIEKGRLLMPDGKIGHAEIEIEGSLLMMADENIDWGNKSPLTIGGNPMSFGLYVKDADAVFQQALDSGAILVMAIEDMFYGDRVGQVMDPFGYKWMISTHKEDVSFEETKKRFDNMMSVQ
ncbi:VOC family protein [Flavobacterium taihuense]|uniref:VOC family protein n=1 Tax=Flavobacterium taihuense TaxID=2857508 RepID=A0ABS6Y067_9FLAO|nr:VOC family protein [Flavobacterium taihuense]MBW4361519.1 VOC family protein [Flavobacterium taihuense]